MKKIRVAIVGAGPSGFSVAEVLRSPEYKKYFDFTIFEKNNYVGGKCLTVFENGKVCNDEAGGYEIGAGVITKQASGYKELNKIIKANNIKTTTYRDKDDSRRILSYYANGLSIELKQLYLKEIFTNPKRFFNVLTGFLKYINDYYYYRRHKNNTEKLSKLYLPASQRYSKEVNTRLLALIQGFGYADSESDLLSPPAIYFHQYLEPKMFIYPILKFPNGTQGIWSKLAKKYPIDSIRLNEEVASIKRTKSKIVLKTLKSDYIFDYLIVASPLKSTFNFLNFNEKDREHILKMKFNHTITILAKVKGLKTISTVNIDACTNKNNSGKVVLSYKRYPNSDYVISTIFLDSKKTYTRKEILDKYEKSLKEDINAKLVDSKSAIIYHWNDYFGHLNTKDLNNGWHDIFDQNIQGKNRTLFVSSGLHMETVGASVQFGTREAKKYAKLWLKESGINS